MSAPHCYKFLYYNCILNSSIPLLLCLIHRGYVVNIFTDLLMHHIISILKHNDPYLILTCLIKIILLALALSSTQLLWTWQGGMKINISFSQGGLEFQKVQEVKGVKFGKRCFSELLGRYESCRLTESWLESFPKYRF